MESTLFLLESLEDNSETWTPYLGKLTIDGIFHLYPNPTGVSAPPTHPDPSSIITIDIASPSTTGVSPWIDGVSGFDITFTNGRKFPFRTPSDSLTSQWVEALSSVTQGGASDLPEIPSVHSSISVDDEAGDAGYMLPGEKSGKLDIDALLASTSLDNEFSEKVRWPV